MATLDIELSNADHEKLSGVTADSGLVPKIEAAHKHQSIPTLHVSLFLTSFLSFPNTFG
jgi:hypothetical protein